MSKGQAGIGAGKGRIELQSPGKEMPRRFVLGLCETVHVPEAAMLVVPKWVWSIGHGPER